MGLRDHLDSLSQEQLIILVGHLADRLGKESDDVIFEDLKRFSTVDPEEIISRLQSRFGYMDDSIYMECGISDKDADELYSPYKASQVITDLVVDEFYDDAKLLEELGMTQELDLMIQSVANGLRKSFSDECYTIISLSGDYPHRLADRMESFIGSENRMGAFGE